VHRRAHSSVLLLGDSWCGVLEGGLGDRVEGQGPGVREEEAGDVAHVGVEEAEAVGFRAECLAVVGGEVLARGGGFGDTGALLEGR